jgi:hypothetical protein
VHLLRNFSDPEKLPLMEIVKHENEKQYLTESSVLEYLLFSTYIILVCTVLQKFIWKEKLLSKLELELANYTLYLTSSVVFQCMEYH